MTFKTWDFRGIFKEDFEGDLEGDLEYQILCDNDWLGVIKTLNENENEVFTPIYCFFMEE